MTDVRRGTPRKWSELTRDELLGTVPWVARIDDPEDAQCDGMVDAPKAVRPSGKRPCRLKARWHFEPMEVKCSDHYPSGIRGDYCFQHLFSCGLHYSMKEAQRLDDWTEHFFGPVTEEEGDVPPTG